MCVNFGFTKYDDVSWESQIGNSNFACLNWSAQPCDKPGKMSLYIDSFFSSPPRKSLVKGEKFVHLYEILKEKQSFANHSLARGLVIRAYRHMSLSIEKFKTVVKNQIWFDFNKRTLLPRYFRKNWSIKGRTAILSLSNRLKCYGKK